MPALQPGMSPDWKSDLLGSRASQPDFVTSAAGSIAPIARSTPRGLPILPA